MNYTNLKIAALLIASLLMTACGGNGNVSSGGGSQQVRSASVSLIGDWVGNVTINGETEYLNLDIRQSGNELNARLYSRAGGSHDYNLKGRLSGNSFTMNGFAGKDTTFELTADATASYLNGSVSQTNSSHKVSFERL